MRKIIGIKICSIILTVFVCFFSSNICFADNVVTVKLDGQPVVFDVSPQIINDRTMIPMRKIFELFGATINWDQNTKTVTSTKGGTTVTLTIDNPNMNVNGNVVTLDTPACIVDNRTLVPVRAVAEAFQTEVGWDENSKTVFIESEDGYKKAARSRAYEQLKKYLLANGNKKCFNWWKSTYSTYYSYGVYSPESELIEFVVVMPETLNYTVDEGNLRYRSFMQHDAAVQLFIYKDKAPTVYCKLARDDRLVLTGTFYSKFSITSTSSSSGVKMGKEQYTYIFDIKEYLRVIQAGLNKCRYGISSFNIKPSIYLSDFGVDASDVYLGLSN